MEDWKKKLKFKLKIGAITIDNVSSVYQKNLQSFVYLLSDEVMVNGEVITDHFKKILMQFSNKNGESNIKTASATGKRGGFPINENDFLEKEIKEINKLEPLNFKQKKQKEIYLNHLIDRKHELNITDKKTDTTPAQKENQHQNIFISNGFDVWHEMYDKFQITARSRTDIKFMFEIMKRDNMIHKTVSQKAYLEWIHDMYSVDVQKTSNIDLKNIKSLGIYNTAKSMFIK